MAGLAGAAAPGSVITSTEVAGFDAASPLGSVITPTEVAGFGLAAAPGSVITLSGVAGFGRAPPCPRTSTPAPLRYALAVSRRTPVSRWMRRSDQPSRPSATTCCRFSSLKTLAIPRRRSVVDDAYVPRATFSGRFSDDHRWPVLGDHRGQRSSTTGGELVATVGLGVDDDPGLGASSVFLGVCIRAPAQATVEVLVGRISCRRRIPCGLPTVGSSACSPSIT